MKSWCLFILFGCLTTSIAQAQQMYGIFMIVKGKVTFQNPSATLEQAKVGSKVFEGTTILTDKDSRAKIVMADRNVLNLSPDSKLTIQKYDATPGKKNVTLSLEEGKVRMNVEQKYDGSKEKFLLKTPTIVAGVRGTQFLGAYDSKTRTSQVVTFKGSVTLTSYSPNGQAIQTVVVEKGQASTATEGKAPEPPKTLPKDEIKELDKSTAGVATETITANPAETGTASTNKEATSEKKTETKVTNTKDLDTDLAQEIKVPTTEPKSNVLPAPTVQVPVTVPASDFVRDAVQTQTPKTKVIINVK